MGLHDPRQPLLFDSSTTLLSKDWIGHGLTQPFCLHDAHVTHVTLRLPVTLFRCLKLVSRANVCGVWRTRLAKSLLNFTVSSKRLVVLVELLLLKSGLAKAGPAGPGATPMGILQYVVAIGIYGRACP